VTSQASKYDVIIYTPYEGLNYTILEKIKVLKYDVITFCIVAASGPTIWTSAYGLEPVLCNRLLIEPSGWAQTVHMFTQRFT